jgi:hypothetical protein
MSPQNSVQILKRQSSQKSDFNKKQPQRTIFSKLLAIFYKILRILFRSVFVEYLALKRGIFFIGGSYVPLRNVHIL